MGQNASCSSKESQFSSSTMVDSAVHEGRGFAFDLKKISSLSWDEFVNLMQKINEKSRSLRETTGKYLIFAIKKGTTETFLWKATVTICCIKVNAVANQIESRKYLNLRQFLKVYSSLVDLMEQQTSNLGHSSDALRASTIISKIDDIKFGRKSDEEEPFNECVICMERQKEVVLPCAHGFCLPCIDQWNELTQVCPTCRTYLKSVDDAWVISDFPEKEEISRYLLQLTDETG